MIKNNNYKKAKANHNSSDQFYEPKNKYFCISKIEIIWDGDSPIGYSFGEASNVYNKEIFQHAFRQKVCNGCGENLPSDKFYWKVKGFEGPFVMLWGIRQPKCIGCEKDSKKVQYKKRTKKLKRVINVISGFKIREVLLTDKEDPKELNRLLLDFSFEVINGANK